MAVEKLKIVEKAWMMNLDKIEEGYLYSECIKYAETKGKAKSKFLYSFDGIPEHEDELTFLNMPVLRCKESDKVLFDDEIIYRYQVEKRIWCKNRDEKSIKLVKENPNSLFFIKAGCYNSYWGPNRAGYMSCYYKRGRYAGKEALNIVLGSSFERKETLELFDKKLHNMEIISDMNRNFREIKNLRNINQKIQAKLL